VTAFKQERSKLLVLAGPNGSGKTTWLDDNSGEIADLGLIVHLNPDAIAREISPEDVTHAAIAAGREVIKRTSDLLERRISFGFETTLAGNHALSVMRQAHDAGYEITLVFVATGNPDVNLQRIARRKAAGGHGIPTTDVLRRYKRSLENLELAVSYSERAHIIDNTSNNQPHEFVRIEYDTVAIYDPVPRFGEAIVTFLKNRP
jgi:predicted ABC-type ATPase